MSLESRTPRRVRAWRDHACAALLVALTALACALPAAGAGGGTAGWARVGVHNREGKAAELLHRMTIPQLAAALNTTPAQLSASIEGSEDAGVGVQLGELLGNPSSTLQEVLNRLAAAG